MIDMSTVYYYPFVMPTKECSSIEEHPMLEVSFDLEKVNPPHTQFKSNIDLCPAMNVTRNHTYLLRSPIDITLSYRNDGRGWATVGQTSETIHSLITPPATDAPYIQLGFHYIFWSEKKSNTQLWMHDIPLHEVNDTPTWYVASGMIPIGKYTRNTTVGLILKSNHT